MKTKVVMELKKSTSGTHVYANKDKDTAIPTLYIKKAALPDTPPSKISVTVKYE